MVQYYTSIYYRTIEQDPEKRTDPDEHYKLCQKINTTYREELEFKYSWWDNEENRQAFMENIEYLARPAATLEKKRVMKEKKEALAMQAFELQKKVDRFTDAGYNTDI